MQLHRQAREWWPGSLTATDSTGQPVTIPATGWEASVDGGTTWHPSRDNAGRPGWLVAGPDHPGTGDSSDPSLTDLHITRTVTPIIRRRDAPETVVANGPAIYLI